MAIPCSPPPSFTYTLYPCSIDGSEQLPITVDNQTAVKGEVVNRHREAIIAIESELGINPSGTYTTVRARLDELETIIQGAVSGGVSIISKNNTPIVTNAVMINFTGSVSVENSGSGVATVNILGGGGGGGDLNPIGPNKVLANVTTFTDYPVESEPNDLVFNNNGTSTKSGFHQVSTVTSVLDGYEASLLFDLSSSGNGLYFFTVVIAANIENTGYKCSAYSFHCIRAGSSISGDEMDEPHDLLFNSMARTSSASELETTFSNSSGNLNIEVVNSSGETADITIAIGYTLVQFP